MTRKTANARRRFSGPIHARIAELRKKLDLSQEELAAKIGVDNTAISHWETGLGRPDIGRLPGLAAALGVTVDELIDGEKAA